MSNRGRPFTEGLFYFSVYTNILDDDKIKLLISECKHDGFACLMYLWIKSYKKAYYIKWGIRERKLFCKDNNFELDQLDSIIDVCLREDLFASDLFRKYEILTSRGMQRVWVDCCYKRTKLDFVKEYILINLKKIYKPERVVLFDVEGRQLNEQQSRRKGNQQIKPQDTERKSPAETRVELTNDNSFTVEKLKSFIAVPYSLREDIFKQSFSEKYYTAYTDFANVIIEKYSTLTNCVNQVTIHEYVRFFTEHKIKQKEFDWALPKLAATGIKNTGSLFWRIVDFVGYMRAEGAASNGSAQNTVDQTRLLYDPKEGLDRTRRK